jgi:hypothetical protein
MDDIIGQALNSLRLYDGAADPQARKEALLCFLKGGHLNVNEFRLLKELLSTVTLQKDILPQLPIELVILITELLSEKDILSCLTVSRAWNATLMSGRVVFSLADRLFPPLTWKASQAGLHKEETRAALRQQFLHQLRKRLVLMERSAQGPPRTYDRSYLWDTETEFKLDGQEYSQFPPPNLPYNQRALYANSRLAWQRETHTLVLDNLRNKSRRILSFPGGKLLGPEMKLAALGDELVVATMGRHIFAWGIGTDKFERKTLPSLPGRCTTFGDRVAIITDEELYTWKLGGSLLSMALPGLDAELLAANQFPKAFVHPRLENVVFVRQVYRNSSYTLRFLVHKFVDQQHVRTFKYDVEMSWLPTERLSSTLEGFIPLSHEVRANDRYYLHEFDMFHEKFSRRDNPHCRRRHNDAFMFTFDDDFVVELSDRHYWAW